jgi:hypothetical protein
MAARIAQFYTCSIRAEPVCPYNEFARSKKHTCKGVHVLLFLNGLHSGKRGPIWALGRELKIPATGTRRYSPVPAHAACTEANIRRDGPVEVSLISAAFPAPSGGLVEDKEIPLP